MREEKSDAELVGNARAGDKAAFGVLFERHRPMLLRRCHRAMDDATLALDAAQEAALLAMLNLDRLRRPDRFGPWLCGIALNVCRRWLRDRAHQGWSRESVVGGRRIDKSIDVLDGRPGPADLAEQSDMAERVRRAVGVLPRRQDACVPIHGHLFLHPRHPCDLSRARPVALP